MKTMGKAVSCALVMAAPFAGCDLLSGKAEEDLEKLIDEKVREAHAPVLDYEDTL